MKKGKRIASAAVIIVIVAFLTLDNWTKEAVKTAHMLPDILKISIENIVGQNHLSNQELQMVSEQTGINMTSVEMLLEQKQGQKLLELQAAYYKPISIVTVRTTPLTVCEYVVDKKGNFTKGTDIVNLQDGDILITKNSRFLGWRNGHAGLVVDAEKGLVLEAVMLGTNTKLCSVSGWEKYPSFLVLRLKDKYQSAYEIEEVVSFAEQNLLDIPYQLHAGLGNKIIGFFGRRHTNRQEKQGGNIAEAVLSGTHCAHVIWYAYQQMGIDLDSDGGLLVTPFDIQNSPYLEIIQSYGY